MARVTAGTAPEKKDVIPAKAGIHSSLPCMKKAGSRLSPGWRAIVGAAFSSY